MRLRFPPFHRELLAQSSWSAGDDLGRIKVVISEGLRRASLPGVFDRVKNVVAFSFQHAPLGECFRCPVEVCRRWLTTAVISRSPRRIIHRMAQFRHVAPSSGHDQLLQSWSSRSVTFLC